MACHRPVAVIDLGQALDLLAGDGPRWPLGHVLSRAGVSDADIDKLGGRRVRELHAAGRLPVSLTLGALVVLEAAERTEDRGYSRSEALAYVGEVATRFVELLPDAALETVTDCPHRQEH